MQMTNSTSPLNKVVPHIDKLIQICHTKYVSYILKPEHLQ